MLYVLSKWYTHRQYWRSFLKEKIGFLILGGQVCKKHFPVLPTWIEEWQVFIRGQGPDALGMNPICGNTALLSQWPELNCAIRTAWQTLDKAKC